MFLATTSLREFWDQEQDLLLLGSWCLRHDQRSAWQSLHAQVMPSPWNDQQRFDDAARYLDTCYERLLKDVADYLNDVHQVAFSLRYWRILIGPWLIHYLHVVYDRYIHLTEAFSLYADLHTVMLSPHSFQVPRDTTEFFHFAKEDVYNLQIFSQLLRGLGYSFPTRMPKESWGPIANGPARLGQGGALKRGARPIIRGFGAVMRGLLRNRWHVALCEIEIPRHIVWTLAWKTGLRALPFEIKTAWSFPLPGPMFDERRNGLAQLPSADGFEHLVVQLLPQNFPILYLEAYRDGRKEIQSRYPMKPSVISSAVGWYVHEPFKFFAAEAADEGRRLVAIQHGGGYGLYRFAPGESHEYRLCDAFMVWGWAAQKADRLHNVPSQKLSCLRSRFRYTPNGHAKTVLFVATTDPRYRYRFYSAPQGAQLEGYFEWEVRFLTMIPDRLRPMVLFRPHRLDFGHHIPERFSARFPDLRWDNGMSFAQRLKQSRLVVVDHLGTSCLGALAANVPTVLFWDPHQWKVRDEAESSLEALRKVGILWETPEAAAAHVEAVYSQPWAWWGSEAVQEVRQGFIARYALGQKDWLDRWVVVLQEQITVSHTRREESLGDHGGRDRRRGLAG